LARSISLPPWSAAARRNALHPYFNRATTLRSENLGEHSALPARFFAGPGILSTDLGLSKSTAIKDGVSPVFRAEFFKVFNHPSFNNPLDSIIRGNFGNITRAREPRIGQLAAKIAF
jgi:hypothetical protein